MTCSPKLYKVTGPKPEQPPSRGILYWAMNPHGKNTIRTPIKVKSKS